MSEAALSRRIVVALRRLPCCYAVKTHGGIYVPIGEPDIRGCIRGRAFFLETKLPGREHTLTPMQAVQLRRWAAAGALAVVVTSVEQAIDVVRGWDAKGPGG